MKAGTFNKCVLMLCYRCVVQLRFSQNVYCTANEWILSDIVYQNSYSRQEYETLEGKSQILCML